MKKMTLLQIWRQHQNPKFSYLIAEHESGVRTHITGCRPADSEGGCMATGTPETLYGNSPDGAHHWFHATQALNDSGWTFISGYGEDFFVRDLETGKVYLGVEETANNFKLIDKGRHFYMGKNRLKRIPTNQICAGCLKEPKKTLWGHLFG